VCRAGVGGVLWIGFFFQAEDGIRDWSVTGVQTCALPIFGAQGTVCAGGRYDGLIEQLGGKPTPACGFAMGIERLLAVAVDAHAEIGRASCREREESGVGGGGVKKKRTSSGREEGTEVGVR